MRAHAAVFLRDVESTPDSAEASVAHRVLGNTHWFAGEYVEARDHLERSLGLFRPVRDDDLALRFGQDSGVAAMLYLAFALWALGDLERATSNIRGAEVRIAALAHVPTRVYGKIHIALFGLMRRDLTQAASNAPELARLARAYDLKYWRPLVLFLEGLAKSESGALADGLEDMRRGAKLVLQNGPLFAPLSNLALGQVEAQAGDLERAIATLEEALVLSERSGHRAFDAELHRARGEMLMRRGPASLAPAEEAFQTSIAVAKRQATRSFELRAALSLAKLYQFTGRPAEAHAVLAPALDGFAPTSQMPEIAEAQALLGTVA
jgi:predicted ATPase